MTATDPPCPCGDSCCSDTFGKATAGQDRSACCQYCGWFSCDVCGWSDPSGKTWMDFYAEQYTPPVPAPSEED